MKNFIITALFLTVYTLFFVPVASADLICQPIYGGGQTCTTAGNIVVNKKVADPVSGGFSENLGVNDNKFAPSQAITFEIKVSNTGTTMVSQIFVKDVFPRFVSFTAGPGNFDNNSKVLSFEVDNLNPNEIRAFTVTGTVASTNNLPSDQTIVCDVNQATVQVANTQSNGQDTVQFCIQKNLVVTPTSIPTTTKGGLKVFPQQVVTTTPSTGPEMLPLLALIPSGLFGVFLRRKSSK